MQTAVKPGLEKFVSSDYTQLGTVTIGLRVFLPLAYTPLQDLFYSF